jgi:hypothetical protein
MKSDSTSRVQPRLSRLFKNRKVTVSPLSEDDMPFLWAAYRKGVWGDILRDDLTRDEFSEAIYLLSKQKMLFAIKAPNKYPVVGIAGMTPGEHCDQADAEWFPWATTRNKLEGSIRAILTLRDLSPFLIWANESQTEFLTHVARYGVLRRMGKFINTKTGKNMATFQSREAQ